MFAKVHKVAQEGTFSSSEYPSWVSVGADDHDE